MQPASQVAKNFYISRVIKIFLVFFLCYSFENIISGINLHMERCHGFDLCFDLKGKLLTQLTPPLLLMR